MADKLDDLAESMQCNDHPLMNSGGICAFCLQEKLGKLVSSSSSTLDAINNSRFFSDRSQVAAQSSSSSPSFTSEHHSKQSLLSISQEPTNPNNAVIDKNRIPFLIAQKKVRAASSSSSSSSDANLMLKRTRSVAPNRVFDGDETQSWINTTPRRKSFWSFLFSKNRWREKPGGEVSISASVSVSERDKEAQTGSGVCSGSGKENESPNSSHASSFGRKVARSRSVGCGSRSFSGDFLEKISTGFGDCTLRRVESQREGKPQIVLHGATVGSTATGSADGIKESVKCGGIFAGFGISSTSYWISDEFKEIHGRISGPHGRSKSRSWAFTSPMRAFRPSKPPISAKDPEEDNDSNKNGKINSNNRNMDASPSILAVRC